ncbi:YSIRK-type signal peptide-containing protein, partial [Streptococcus suis]
MNRSKKKSFDWYGMRQRFSIRKYHIGAASVLLGMTLVLSAGTIVSAETGVNGDGTSNEQTLPVNDAGTSDGTNSTTQQQSDNQGNNSSGVQTGNTTNSTANVQPADDTGSASSQPVGTSRSANTGTQGDGTTNPTVAEPIMIIPSSASEKAPKGYVTVTFVGHKYTRGFTLGNQTDSSVKVFVKNGVTWGTLLDDPAWQWPTVKTDEGDTVVGWGSHTNYSASVAFVYDKMKDQVVRNTQLWPNVVYEVEDVHSTIDAYLKQYGADEQDKWLFVTFDAGQGATLKGTTNQSKSVAVYYQNIGYDNSLFTKKVVNGVLANHTFVRWQTADGKVLPTSGTITSTEVYNALYLAHPTDKTTVFDANKLTETEKDSLKQAISNANPTSANLIQSITVSDTGEATVTYNDGTVVTVPATALIFEDKEPARNLAKEEIDDKLAEEKAAIEAKRDAAIAEINNTPGLTDDQKDAAKKAVTETAGKALTDLDTAADDAKKAIDTKTTAADFNDAKTAGEKALDDATATGEAAIELTKEKELAKADVDNQAKAAIEAIKNNPNLNEDEQAPYIQAVENATKEQKAAIDAAKDTAGITAAVNAAEKVNEEQQLAAAKEDAKDKIAE